LTELGETQARSVRDTYPFLFSSPAYLVSSPFRRTLQTALLAFNRKPLPHPGFQENSAKPCDTGSPRSVLEKEFSDLDFELLDDEWNSKKGEWGPDEVSLANRAMKMRRWLKDHKENEIIVVTHGGFLLYLVQEIKGFENAECRSYTFADCEEAILVPLEEKP
jgi:broad specificity phosphatase PhoE